MSADDRMIDHLLDVLVYAPVGLAYEAKELIPKLAERGRGQVALLRLAQQVAARQGAPDTAERIRATVGDAFDTIGAWFGVDSGSCVADDAGGASGPASGGAEGCAETGGASGAETEASGSDAGGASGSDAAETETLDGITLGGTEVEVPFAGYDSMEAREIIASMASLTATELQAVLRYEQDNRARSTVLNRLAQLLG